MRKTKTSKVADNFFITVNKNCPKVAHNFLKINENSCCFALIFDKLSATFGQFLLTVMKKLSAAFGHFFPAALHTWMKFFQLETKIPLSEDCFCCFWGQCRSSEKFYPKIFKWVGLSLSIASLSLLLHISTISRQFICYILPKIK